jgi:Icc-related predicted phosphoesterase
VGTLKILFASDLHGSDLCYRKFLKAIQNYKADVAIIGGDLTGKALVPVIAKKDGSYVATLFGVEHRARDEKELARLIDRISAVGFYYKIVTIGEYEELSQNDSLLKEVFKELIVDRIKKWLDLAENVVKEHKVQFLLMPGNDDIYEIDEIINKSEHVVNPAGKIIQINGVHEVVGCDHANITPWKCPRDIEDTALEAKLEEIMMNVKNKNTAILVAHAPPYGTKIDLAPALDKDLKYITKGGQAIFEHVGSKAVRKIIEKYQPLLGLHGHIHESKGYDKIGRTLIINPGSEYNEGILHVALVVISGDKIKGHMILTG